VVALLIKAHRDHGAFAGVFAPITPYDQFRYLAWIRDAGEHVLIANRSGSSSSGHLYLHPIFLLSGLGWRLGLSLQLAYLAWFPAAVGSILFGFRAYVRRLLPARRLAATAALVIALFYLTPLVPLLDYGRIVTATGATDLITQAGPLAPFWELWGYLPTALALGLMPVYFLGLERTLDQVPGGSQHPPPRHLFPVAAAGLASAWLSPWGGLTLLLVTIAVGLLQRRLRALIVPVAAISAPLVYYLILWRVSPAWGLTAIQSLGIWDPHWLTTLAVLTPLALLAAMALRGAGGEPQEQIVRLWPVVALACFVILPATSRMLALTGATLPLAVLAVRAWNRRVHRAAVGAAGVALLTLPGMAYAAHTFRDYVRNAATPYTLAQPEMAALRYVASSRPGRTLTTPYLSAALPALVGATSSGGYDLTGANLVLPSDAVERIFNGHASLDATRQAVVRFDARTLVSDCRPARADLTRLLAPLGYEKRSFGCASVYHSVRQASTSR